MAITGIQGTNAPNIIIQEGSSTQSFSTVNNTWVFGTVKVVYAGCMKFDIDEIVFFDKSQARRFKSGSTNYYAIDENYVYFKETEVLP